MADEDVLTQINAVELTTRDMLAFFIAGTTMDDVRAPSPLEPRHHGRKAFALLSRLQALAELLDDGLPGWASPCQASPGASLASRAIVAAAAEQPLIVRDRAYVFDRTAFLERVALIAERECRPRVPVPSSATPGSDD